MTLVVDPVMVASTGGRLLDPDAVEAVNSGRWTSYYPPCPPSGVHHYRFTVYALARRTGLRQGAGLEQALRAVESAAFAQGRLVGLYQRVG